MRVNSYKTNSIDITEEFQYLIKKAADRGSSTEESRIVALLKKDAIAGAFL